MKLPRVDLIQIIDLAIRAQLAKEKRAGTFPPHSEFLEKLYTLRTQLTSGGPLYITGKLPGAGRS
jgi:hypothetical protein